MEEISKTVARNAWRLIGIRAEERGKTPTAFAASLVVPGVSDKTVRRTLDAAIESPGLLQVAALARALGVEAFELLLPEGFSREMPRGERAAYPAKRPFLLSENQMSVVMADVADIEFAAGMRWSIKLAEWAEALHLAAEEERRKKIARKPRKQPKASPARGGPDDLFSRSPRTTEHDEHHDDQSKGVQGKGSNNAA